MALDYVLFKMNNVLINHLILHYFFVCRFNEGVFSLSVQLNSQFFDNIPSSLKGWKIRYFFLQLSSPPNCPISFLSSLSTQSKLPQAYKFEAPYIWSQELVERKKLSSSILIFEENITVYGLSIQVVDSTDQAIDNFDASVTQPGIFFFFHAFVFIPLSFYVSPLNLLVIFFGR